MMNEDILKALRKLKIETGSLACWGCGYEHNCGVHGCRIMREAAGLIESLTDRCARYAEEITVLQEQEKTRGKAEKEGRVIVMPVRPVLTPEISSTLYIIEDGEIYEDWLCEVEVGMSESGETNAIYFTLEGQMSFEQADIGKTVFLTREEAERMLEA